MTNGEQRLKVNSLKDAQRPNEHMWIKSRKQCINKMEMLINRRCEKEPKKILGRW